MLRVSLHLTAPRTLLKFESHFHHNFPASSDEIRMSDFSGIVDEESASALDETSIGASASAPSFSQKRDADKGAVSAPAPTWSSGKVAAIKALPQQVAKRPSFAAFLSDALCDKFLAASVDYFVYLSAGNFNSNIPSSPEAIRLLAVVGGHYGSMLIKFSNSAHTQLDAILWESIYNFSCSVILNVLQSSADTLPHVLPIVENVFGSIFRTPAFNMAKRKHEVAANARAQSLKSIDLYNLRHHTDPFTASKILSQLHPRKKSEEAISHCIHSRSPILSSVVPKATVSPVKARAHNLSKTAATSTALSS
jgi:hypothetical protein